MFSEYLSGIVKFAFRSAYDGVDRLATLSGLLIPAIYDLTGETMPENVFGHVAIYGLAALCAVTFARMFCAPFFLWKEQRLRIATLENDLSLPSRQIKTRLQENEAKIREEMITIVMAIHQKVIGGQPQTLLRDSISVPRFIEYLFRLNHDERLADSIADFILAIQAVQAAKLAKAAGKGEEAGVLEAVHQYGVSVERLVETLKLQYN